MTQKLETKTVDNQPTRSYFTETQLGSGFDGEIINAVTATTPEQAQEHLETNLSKAKEGETVRQYWVIDGVEYQVCECQIKQDGYLNWTHKMTDKAIRFIDDSYPIYSGSYSVDDETDNAIKNISNVLILGDKALKTVTIQIVRDSKPPRWNAEGTEFGNKDGMYKITSVPDGLLYEDSDGELIRTGGGGITCIIERLVHHKGVAFNIKRGTTLVNNKEEAVELIKSFHSK